MNRRAFVTRTLASAAALAAAPLTALARQGAVPPVPARPAGKFQLRYAPSFGQFKAHAGTDLLAQIQFAEAEGFTAMFDNGLMNRPVDAAGTDRARTRQAEHGDRTVRAPRGVRPEELRPA